MHPIVYDVAVSLDGFISGPNGDISQFAHEGPVVDDYMARLGGYHTAVMGRKTYEFGYAYGLTPGANPYPHMTTHVFSNSLEVPEDREVVQVSENWAGALLELKKQSQGPIYLCGGGEFAGRVLQEGLIDLVILKRAPCVYGAGVSLFGGRSGSKAFHRVESRSYDNGYLLETFEVR